MGAPQHVILKMDDLTTSWWREWKILTDICIAENVRAGLGIWFASLLEGDAAYDAWIDGIVRDARFELWFHGFTGSGPNGEPGREHQGTPYEYQVASFEKSLDAMLTRCDRIVRTYSEHWHGGDATTLRVFNEDPFLRLWMCWQWSHKEEREQLLPPNRRLLGGSMVTIECPDPKNWQPGYVNFSEFEREYAGHEGDPVVILQGHPWSWTGTSAKPDRTGSTLDRWKEFRKILGFLKARDVRFVTPYDYYRIAMGYATDMTPPAAPTGLKAAPAGNGRVTLTWIPSTDAGSGVDCYKIYRGGRPVGLSIDPTWTGPAPAHASKRFEVVAVDRAELSSPRSGPASLPR